MFEKHFPEEWTDGKGVKRLTCSCGNKLPCPHEPPPFPTGNYQTGSKDSEAVEVGPQEGSRLELLGAVAACAPKDWEFFQMTGGICFSAPTGQYDRSWPDPHQYVEMGYLDLSNDLRSAGAIILMLQEMEAIGSRPAVWRDVAGNYCGCLLEAADNPDDFEVWPTRTEATARLFVAVMTSAKAAESTPAKTPAGEQVFTPETHPELCALLEEAERESPSHTSVGEE